MSLLLATVLLVLIQLTIGVPLTATEDLSKYFPRIVGGEEAAKNAAPHMSALVISDFVTILVCGASIITSRHLLTAAHCIDGFVIWTKFKGELLQSYHAIVGTNDWFRNGTYVSISKFYIHPRWDPKNIKNDVGILKTNNYLSLSAKVAVIALNFDKIRGGEKAVVTGWGRLQTGGITPYKLQILSVSILSHKQCARDLLQSPVWGSFPPTLQADVEICTFHSDKQGLCQGDSGSPLVLSDLQEQVGIASWGYYCARGVPDVFTRMSGVQDFVLFILRGYLDRTD